VHIFDPAVFHVEVTHEKHCFTFLTLRIHGVAQCCNCSEEQVGGLDTAKKKEKEKKSQDQRVQLTVEPLLLVGQPRTVACVWHVDIEDYESAMVGEHAAAFAIQGKVAKWRAVGTETQAVAHECGDPVEPEPLTTRAVVETPERVPVIVQRRAFVKDQFSCSKRR